MKDRKVAQAKGFDLATGEERNAVVLFNGATYVLGVVGKVEGEWMMLDDDLLLSFEDACVAMAKVCAKWEKATLKFITPF